MRLSYMHSFPHKATPQVPSIVWYVSLGSAWRRRLGVGLEWARMVAVITPEKRSLDWPGENPASYLACPGIAGKRGH